MEEITNVVWKWRGDTSWVEYEKEFILELEDEFYKGTKRVKVDDERFIDLSLNV